MAATDHDDIEFLRVQHAKPRAECALARKPLILRDKAADDVDNPAMDCRPGCAACCIAPSISSALPGLPAGKPAGLPCPQLDSELRCRLFGRPERPAVCASLRPQHEMCGDDRGQALAWLTLLEARSCPSAAPRQCPKHA
jgi:hypothetical protein